MDRGALMSCAHIATLTACLESVIPETGAPIYAPTSMEQAADLVEHFLGCYS